MHIDEFTQHRVSRRSVLRRAAGGLVLAGLGGGLAACGSSSSGSDGAEKVTISAWYDHPELRKPLQDLIEAFHESHPSIELDMAPKPGDQFDTLLKTALVGGAAPDALGFIGAGNTRSGKRYARPLGDKLDVSKLTPVAKHAVVFDNQVWGCPLSAYLYAVYYHRPIFQKYGIQPPKTWDELLAACKTLKANGVTPWSMPAKDILNPFGFYMLAINSILGEDAMNLLATGKRNLTHPDLVRAAQLLIDLKPYYNKGYAAVGYVEGKSLFAQGRTAMIVGGSSDYSAYKQLNPKADLGVFAFPSPDGSKQVTLTATDMVYCVNNKTRHVPQVQTFVTWLATKEAQHIVADKLGVPIIEGVTPTSGGDAERVAKELVAAGNPTTIQWTEDPALIGSFTGAAKSTGIFSGSLDAMGFAKNVQNAISL